ncbi:leucine-rich repeat-containing protein 15-like [Venturia canescens]|uniref:leucine-rich repeat-containing protein 15-like n=1 Tax=Venturia canescens TaxID=32260 RepID=UPI001C9D2369|nr:leucine-rich repeat-containing protein 15-like [Venturia canescens]XP_043280855.1 leucine-rich repeat-containing protein 15-like [Venturia canescens]XP_043280863.1 leucine-rich repeat-containing protein 15-like [Venturia canescens]XP_043280872.1 leucine-rich repeat-containing protein 15-like [Venturia canescens]
MNIRNSYLFAKNNSMFLFGCFMVPTVLAVIEEPLIKDHYTQKGSLGHKGWFNTSNMSLSQYRDRSAKLMDTLLLGQPVYDVSQALFECDLLLDHKKNETESQMAVEKMINIEKTRQSTFGIKISELNGAKNDDIAGFNKNAKVKICIQHRRLVSLEVLIEGEVLGSDCTEVKVNSRIHSISLRRFGISTFAKGWYRLKSLPVHFLDLSNNDIVNMTSELLNDLPADVSSVSLADNQIERLEAGIISNKNLRQLNLENNFISYIADGALLGTKLSRLFLSINQLTHTRFAATLPSSLRELTLAQNQIHEIWPLSFVKLNNLEYLNFAENNISNIETESLRGLSSVSRLVFVENNIKSIKPGSFNDLKKLVSLNLYKNNLTSLESGIFGNLKNLKYLNIGFNEFTKIRPDFFRGLSVTLQMLYLDFNRIESLESGTFINVPKHRLSLRGNKITTIQKGSFNLPHLQELNLEANALSILDGDAFESLSNLRFLTLRKNCIKKIVNFLFWKDQTLRLKSGKLVVFLNCQKQGYPLLKC